MSIINISLQIIASATGTQGQTMSMEAGQSLSFGQSKAADIALPEDTQLQARHLTITFDGSACQLALLDSQSALYLNGKAVQQASLKDRDQILAGQTVIEIRMEDISQIRKQVLAYLQRQPRPFYAMIDLAQDKSIYPLLQGYPDTLKQNLFAGEQGQKVETQAPHLVQFTKADDALLEQLVMQGWGENWGVYLFAPISFEAVRQHIRQCLRVKARGEYLLFRFYDPRIFVDIVSGFSLQQVVDFFGPIHSYLLEDENTKRMLRSQLSNHQTAVQPESKVNIPVNPESPSEVTPAPQHPLPPMTRS